ncbi:polysaccharide biosynthesis tyrosine autokinase [Nocardioides sp. Kera G14]|uniref:polysaccharide biosynthesis tyrosine autokinase n=1 Tax=Nocardioides sp. Kera G14 TaxID=2884264 RepID=UPI001D1053AC|nr:polysaccharide biosynthesis tyrosine autokinase [Nocardioides sp. Kera G14]UDY24919.1 hypothetical protein LH076_06405 [Nocardioides sp. Kera G14]
MDLREYLLLLLRRWPIFIGSFVVVTAALLSLSFFAVPTYQATASVYLHAVPALASGASASEPMTPQLAVSAQQSGDLLLLARMKSYALAVNSEAVIDPVIDSLGLDEDFSSVNSRVTTNVPSDSFVIEITTTDTTAASAANLANALAQELPDAAAALDGRTNSHRSEIQFEPMQQALPPKARISPNLKLNGAIAVLLGLFVGVGLAVLVETFDSRLRRGSQVAAAGVRFLGAVPSLGRTEARRAYWPAELPDSVRYLFDRVSVEVLFGAGGAPASIILTSPRPGAGTTLVGAGVAASLAASGSRVLYIDADDEGDGLAGRVGLADVDGLTDVLAERVELGAALHYWEDGGYTIMPIGSGAMRETEMLGSAFGRVHATLTDLFDVILIDTPDITSHPSAGLLLQHVHHVLVVAQARRTRRGEFLDALDAANRAGAEVVGVVMTQVSRSGQVASAAEFTPRRSVPS